MASVKWLHAVEIARVKVVERVTDPSREGTSNLTEDQLELLLSILDSQAVRAVAQELAAQGRCANPSCGHDLGDDELRRDAAARAAATCDDEDDDEGAVEPRFGASGDCSGSDDDLDAGVAAAFDKRQRRSVDDESAENTMIQNIQRSLPAALFCDDRCCLVARTRALEGFKLSPNDPMLVHRIQVLFPGIRALAEETAAQTVVAAVSEKASAGKKRSVDGKKVVFADQLVDSSADGAGSMPASEMPPGRAAAPHQPPTAPAWRTAPVPRPPAPNLAREALEVLLATVTPYTAWIFRTNQRALKARLTSPLKYVPEGVSAPATAGNPDPRRPPKIVRDTAEDERATRLLQGLLRELPRASLLLRTTLVDDPKLVALLSTVVSRTMAFDTEFRISPESSLVLLLVLLTAMTATDSHVHDLLTGHDAELEEVIDAMHISPAVFGELVRLLY